MRETLGPWIDRYDAIARAASGHSLEASIREGDARWARITIEGVSPALARVVLTELGVEGRDEARVLLEASERLGVRTIVGWDTSTEPIAKVYANASDASPEVRRELSRIHASSEEAHIVGVNLGLRAATWKVYRQWTEPPSAGPRATAYFEAAKAHAGGFVTSTRGASFVALRGVSSEAHPLVARLGPLPEPPFPVREVSSVGFSDGDERWTLYVKDRGGAGHDLHPIAAFACDDCELAVFAEPASGARRAYRVLGDRALSYRVRRGTPDRAQVAALFDWFGSAEAEPPAPWRRTPI